MARPVSTRSETGLGFAYTLGAFLLWGLSPLFWKQLGHLPPLDTVAHRIVWCALGLGAWLGWSTRHRRSSGAPSAVRRVLTDRRTLGALLASTTLIGANWFLYIWGVANERILDISLGYFINPLVSVVLGLAFLGERLRPLQWLSVATATGGVAVLATHLGGVPWLSLALAGSFGVYALVRKVVDASPAEGLAFETWLLAPVCIGFFLFGGGVGPVDAIRDPAALHAPWIVALLLLGTGLMTAVPLLWFTHGAKRLPLSTVGLLQYLAPTLQFLLAVFFYLEPFGRTHLLAFACIWVSLGLFTIDAFRFARRRRADRLRGRKFATDLQELHEP